MVNCSVYIYLHTAEAVLGYNLTNQQGFNSDLNSMKNIPQMYLKEQVYIIYS